MDTYTKLLKDSGLRFEQSKRDLQEHTDLSGGESGRMKPGKIFTATASKVGAYGVQFELKFSDGEGRFFLPIVKFSQNSNVGVPSVGTDFMVRYPNLVLFSGMRPFLWCNYSYQLYKK